MLAIVPRTSDRYFVASNATGPLGQAAASEQNMTCRPRAAVIVLWCWTLTPRPSPNELSVLLRRLMSG
jgi:hypothetical protein